MHGTGELMADSRVKFRLDLNDRRDMQILILGMHGTGELMADSRVKFRLD